MLGERDVGSVSGRAIEQRVRRVKGDRSFHETFGAHGRRARELNEPADQQSFAWPWGNRSEIKQVRHDFLRRDVRRVQQRGPKFPPP